MTPADKAKQLAECARGELVVALHTLASHFENSLYAFRDDAEARKKAEGDIAHAMKIAAKHNYNGPGCAQVEAPAEPVAWAIRSKSANFLGLYANEGHARTMFEAKTLPPDAELLPLYAALPAAPES
jgi:hypothetical protein